MSNFIQRLEPALQNEQLMQELIKDIQDKKLNFPELKEEIYLGLIKDLSSWLPNARIPNDLLASFCKIWSQEIYSQMSWASTLKTVRFPLYLGSQLFRILNNYGYLPDTSQNQAFLVADNAESSAKRKRKRDSSQGNQEPKTKKIKVPSEKINTIEAANLSIEIKEQLIKYGIGLEDFLSESKALSILGYKEDEISRILFKKSPLTAVKLLKSQHNELIVTFTHKQLSHIVNRGGSTTLKCP